MNARQFFDIVATMRYAQREYFRTRSKEWLVKSKQYEKEVDGEIRRVENLGMPKEQKGGEQ